MGNITVVGVTPEFKEFDKINEVYEEAFPPAERKLTIEQMPALPLFKLDVNTYYCDGNCPAGCRDFCLYLPPDVFFQV